MRLIGKIVDDVLFPTIFLREFDSKRFLRDIKVSYADIYKSLYLKVFF